MIAGSSFSSVQGQTVDVNAHPVDAHVQTADAYTNLGTTPAQSVNGVLTRALPPSSRVVQTLDYFVRVRDRQKAYAARVGGEQARNLAEKWFIPPGIILPLTYRRSQISTEHEFLDQNGATKPSVARPPSNAHPLIPVNALDSAVFLGMRTVIPLNSFHTTGGEACVQWVRRFTLPPSRLLGVDWDTYSYNSGAYKRVLSDTPGRQSHQWDGTIDLSLANEWDAATIRATLAFASDNGSNVVHNPEELRMCVNIPPHAPATEMLISWPTIPRLKSGLYELQHTFPNHTSFDLLSGPTHGCKLVGEHSDSHIGADCLSIGHCAFICDRHCQLLLQDCGGHGYCYTLLYSNKYLFSTCQCFHGYAGSSCEKKTISTLHRNLLIWGILASNLMGFCSVATCLYLLLAKKTRFSHTQHDNTYHERTHHYGRQRDGSQRDGNQRDGSQRDGSQKETALREVILGTPVLDPNLFQEGTVLERSSVERTAVERSKFRSMRLPTPNYDGSSHADLPIESNKRNRIFSPTWEKSTWEVEKVRRVQNPLHRFTIVVSAFCMISLIWWSFCYHLSECTAAAFDVKQGRFWTPPAQIEKASDGFAHQYFPTGWNVHTWPTPGHWIAPSHWIAQDESTLALRAPLRFPRSEVLLRASYRLGNGAVPSDCADLHDETLCAELAADNPLVSELDAQMSSHGEGYSEEDLLKENSPMEQNGLLGKKRLSLLQLPTSAVVALRNVSSAELGSEDDMSVTSAEVMGDAWGFVVRAKWSLLQRIDCFHAFLMGNLGLMMVAKITKWSIFISWLLTACLSLWFFMFVKKGSPAMQQIPRYIFLLVTLLILYLRLARLPSLATSIRHLTKSIRHNNNLATYIHNSPSTPAWNPETPAGIFPTNNSGILPPHSGSVVRIGITHFTHSQALEIDSKPTFRNKSDQAWRIAYCIATVFLLIMSAISWVNCTGGPWKIPDRYYRWHTLWHVCVMSIQIPVLLAIY